MATAQKRSLLNRRDDPEQNRVYDEATLGEASPDTAPTSGGRAIDQLKADLIGNPLDDNDDATEFPTPEREES